MTLGLPPGMLLGGEALALLLGDPALTVSQRDSQTFPERPPASLTSGQLLGASGP